jgi:hypothetical protein
LRPVAFDTKVGQSLRDEELAKKERPATCHRRCGPFVAESYPRHL